VKIEAPPFDYERLQAELAVHLPCRHLRRIVGRKKKKNGRTFYRLQCPDCGKALSNQLKFAKVDELTNEGVEIRDWDFDKEELYWRQYHKYSWPIYEKVHQERRDKWWNDYQTYQNSNEWKARVTKVMRRTNGICERCRQQKAIHVHHLTYERVGEEELEDLQALCFDCHDDAHEGKLFIDRILRQVDRDLGSTLDAISS
jgi:5-methylcytosine-specific restriction endonuclease McrA